MTEYYKEDHLPLAEYCPECDDAYQLGTEKCPVCGTELEEV